MEKVTLDTLTQDSVSIRKQQYVIQGNVEYLIGTPWFRGYKNSINGRKEVQEEVSEPYKSVILMMWGETPTVSDKIV